jgi:hypothetical protein
MYICINEKRHRIIIHPLWQKKEKMREQHTEKQYIGAQPLQLPPYKISRK